LHPSLSAPLARVQEKAEQPVSLQLGDGKGGLSLWLAWVNAGRTPMHVRAGELAGYVVHVIGDDWSRGRHVMDDDEVKTVGAHRAYAAAKDLHDVAFQITCICLLIRH
jgi:hypothetical protein